MSGQALRQDIINYMNSNKGARGWFPTWWFKFHIAGHSDSKQIRRELEKMEKDGLVTSDRMQSNNTLWKLVEVAA